MNFGFMFDIRMSLRWIFYRF